jgi:hypothetical protein
MQLLYQMKEAHPVMMMQLLVGELVEAEYDDPFLFIYLFIYFILYKT